MYEGVNHRFAIAVLCCVPVLLFISVCVCVRSGFGGSDRFGKVLGST